MVADPTSPSSLDDDDTLLVGLRTATQLGEVEPLVRGATIGRYVVRDRVGRGGMGEVYEAFDPDLDRRIAIKLVNTRTAGDPVEQRNLIAEAHALARLSDPHVVHVFDAGTHQGRVFVAMEFVEGTTVQAWMRAQDRGWREIVELFVGAGRGLAAAHSAGIVHGDFKPTNVMVGTDGRARVFDFGVARSTADGLDLFTSLDGRSSSGALRLSVTTVRGTPGYMAPELFRDGFAHPAADQFAFCVALYEALWRQRPFAGDRIDELRKHVQAGDVREPPASDVPAALRRIVWRGLRVDPTQRFPDMPHLLALLERLLHRRRRWAFAGLVAVPSAMVVGALAFASPSHSRCTAGDERTAAIWDDARRTDVRDAFAAVGKSYADELGARVVAQMDDYAQGWADAYRDTCEQDGSAEAAQLDRSMACLSNMLVDFEATARLLSAADSVVAREGIHAVARLPQPSLCADPVHVDGDAVEPDPAAAADVAALRQELAEVRALARAAKFEDAAAKARPLVERAAAFPGTTIDAEAKFAYAISLDLAAKVPEAERAYFETIAAAAEARDTTIEAESWVNLVRVATSAARLQDAHRNARQAQALLDRKGSDERLAVSLHMHLGGLALVEADYTTAIREFEAGLELGERVLTPGDGRIAGILNNLGAAYGTQGDHHKALDHFQRAYQIKRDALGPAHPDTATCLSNLAVTYERLGENDEALELYRKAVELRTLSLGPDHSDTGVALHNLGSMNTHIGRIEEALELYDRALAIKRKNLGEEHPSTALTENNIGDALVRLGRYREAVPHLERAIETLRTKLGEEHPNVGFALHSLGEAQLGLGRAPQAVELFERVLMLRETHKIDRLEIGRTRFALARALVASKGDRVRALRLANEAIADYEAIAPRSAAELAPIRKWLAAQ